MTAKTSEGAGTSAVDWRGRLLVLFEFTLLACIANSLALQLPGSTPFLVGNMAGVAVALRFGFALSLPVALAATAITAEPAWCLLAVLECRWWPASARPTSGCSRAGGGSGCRSYQWQSGPPSRLRGPSRWPGALGSRWCWPPAPPRWPVPRCWPG